MQPAPVGQPVRQLQQAEEAAAELRVRLVGDQLEQRRVAVADRRRGGALAQRELRAPAIASLPQIVANSSNGRCSEGQASSAS